MIERLITSAPGIIAIVAGVYLLQFDSDLPQGQTWFEIMSRGIGAYFIARGCHMIATIHRQDQLVGLARKQLEANAHQHVARTAPQAPPATTP